MSSESPSFVEETASNMLKELQSWWEVPSLAQYISLFREAFNLPEIEIEELENGIIDDCVKGPNEWLQNLVIAFLKSIMPGRVNPTNWEVQLKKLVKRKWGASQYSERENPFQEDKSFHELNLRSKVEVLYCLSLYRLDNNDITEIMKSMDAEALRVQKLGFDDAGNNYWYFYGTRLYKEEPIEEKKTWDEEWKEQKSKTFSKRRGRGRPPKKQKVQKDVEEETFKDDRFMNVSEKSRWSVVCDTLEEWVNFTEKFKTSKSKNEKNLFQIIQENFLPTLNKIYEEKERKLQQKIKELLPAREKIVTRRETRRMRGDTGGDINYALLNGYDSDDEYRVRNQDDYKGVEVKSRAERLEERNKRASEAGYAGAHKRVKHSDDSKDSSENSSDNSESCELDLMTQMQSLISSVKLHKDAWPFVDPVKEEDAPGYYEIIKDPIDLSTIQSRLHSGDYETVGDLDEDFSKMVSNCELYNGEHHPFSKMAQTLHEQFRKEVANLLEMLETVDSSNPDSEESNDSQYHSSSNSNTSSPPHESSVVEPKDHNKRVKNREKRRRGNQEALDILAQAADFAVQADIVNSPSPTQNKSPSSQETMPAPYDVPSTNMPYSAASSSSPSTLKTSVPVSSPSFISVSSSPQQVKKNKPVIVRAKSSNVDKRNSPVENVVSTSLNTVSSNNTIQQTNVNQSFNPKTVPVILSSSSPNQTDLRIHTNPMPSTTMQSNICMPNGLPVVQQVVIPAGTQLPNTGQQFVFATPQNAIRILNKGQSAPLQNTVGQLNQGFVKVVPQLISSAPGVPSYQIQTLSPNTTQAFTQVAQNSQFVSVPYIVSNQNSIINSTSQPTMSYQPFQMPARTMHISGQGNS